MKLTTTFLLVALLGVSTALATSTPSQLNGLKEDCVDEQPPVDDNNPRPSGPYKQAPHPPSGKGHKHRKHRKHRNGGGPPSVESNHTPDDNDYVPFHPDGDVPPTHDDDVPPTHDDDDDEDDDDDDDKTHTKEEDCPPAAKSACSSSVIAELIGVDVLNCANLNILTSGKREEAFPRANIHDPVLEEMKRRSGFEKRGICKSSVASKLIALNILSCADVNVLTASDKQLDNDTCSSEEVGLLAAIGLLNCPKINVLTGKRDQQSKRVVTAARREEAHKSMVERMLNVRDCASQTSGELIAADILNCANLNVLTEGEKVPEECSTSTTADLLALSALNCANVNILTSSD